MGSGGEEQGNIAPQDEEDRKRLKSSCSLWSIAIILFLVFALCLFLLLLFRAKDIDSPSLSWKFWQKNVPAQDLSGVLSSQIANSKAGEPVTVKITEEELTKLLDLSGPGFPLKKPSLKIASDKIILSGRTGSSFLAMNVEVGLKPKATEGKLVFDITEIKTAGVPAPSKINQSVSQGLASYLTVDSPGEIDVIEANLADDYLLLTGTKK